MVAGSPPDTTAPSAPAGLAGSAVSSSQINLTWTASTDNVGVIKYQIFRAGTLIASTTGTTFSDTGLTAATQYAYTVKAVDAAGNLSASSNSVNVTTQSVADTIAPTVSMTAPADGSTVSGTSV